MVNHRAPDLSPLDDITLRRLADVIKPQIAPTQKEKWVDRVIVWGIAILLAWTTLQIDVAVLKSRVDTQELLLREMRQDIKTILSRVR